MSDRDTTEKALRDDMEGMSDNLLIDRMAGYNAKLRRGRRLVAEGDTILKETINLFVMCQNELNGRMHRRVEHETDRYDRVRPA
jgi:hypothetical protein